MTFPFELSPLPSQPLKTEHLDAVLQELPSSLFALVVDQAPTAITVTDLNANICYANQAFCALTEYPLEEIKGCNQRFLASNKTPAEQYKQLWETINSGKPWQGRLVNRKFGGDEYLAELTISPVFNNEGEMTHFLGMQRDISDAYNLTQRLANQKAQVEKVLNSTPNAIAVMDEQGQVRLDNISYKTLRADFGQQEPVQKINRLLKAQHGFSLQHLVNDSDPVPVQFKVRGETRWLGVSCTTLPEAIENASYYFDRRSRGLTLLIASDITEAQKFQRQTELAQLDGQLNERKVLSAVRETLQTAIYRLSQPVNLLQAARRLGSPLDAQDSQALSEILLSAEWALKSMQQDCPEPFHDDHEPIGIISLLNDVTDLLESKAVRLGVKLSLNNIPHPARLLAQRLRILSALELVIQHALLAATKGHELGRSEPRVAIQAQLSDDELTISVEDNGPLLDAVGSHRILQPFYSREQLQDEFGLGLSLARNIVLDHSGSVDIENSDLGGCRIVLHLPLYKDTHERRV